ncbi:hypothetical protein GQ43DRAFT_360972 [Delitschia confertaspora ATCC 74209]|uniref:Uncharacterized protein n=1 Tax=Delitschia confertaspora ATCC 74209 TaxID=1513339 RepID=A0A9P4MXD7_9PLEO|nr:hypothetical protein GQ43DRAFT_360972 [Delitschia confertaspora ATCC 74209]
MDIDNDRDGSKPIDSTILNPLDIVKSPHNRKLLELTQQLREMFLEFSKYQKENPQNPNPQTQEEIDKEEKVEIELQKKRKRILAQTSIIKTAHRVSVMKMREDKELTAKAKQENDALVLQLQNLKYEEQSLEKEISAARNFDHKYTKLPLIAVGEFLKLFPEYAGKPEPELMAARIDHEHKERVKMEEQRQEKLKAKQELMVEVRRRKEDLGKLDERLEKFIDAAGPIEAVLAKE